MAGDLTLRVTEYDGPARWRWILTDPAGAEIGDHTVILDPLAWQFRALTGLEEYLRRHAAPGDPFGSQTRIMAEVSRWAGEQLLGPLGPTLAARAPVTLQVAVPHEARAIAFLPLEAAEAVGRRLAMQRINLAIQVGVLPSAAPRVKDPVADRLRILALFSLPEGTSALNLRKERYGLERLVEEIAGTNNKAIELKVLQYGVTRGRLRSFAEQAEGWDVLHLSGHALAGGLLLEHEDGSRDLVGTEDLVELLSPLVDRVKLVTASACSTAAVTAAEQLRLLGLQGDNGPDDVAEAGGAPVSALAVRLADRLDAAVLAMRFPVTDEFAIGLAAGLYDRVLGKGQPLPGALGLALPPLLDVGRHPPISVATPAVFGWRAGASRLDAPRGGPVVFDDELVKLSGFPAQAERFVGRSGLMARANAALAPRSGASGVVLHGMAGAGKTACALELAYTHNDDFQALAWHKAPDASSDGAADAAADTLRFAACLDDKVSGLNLAALVSDPPALWRFLPRLTELCRRQRLLVVLDNAESVLTGEGEWRDPAMGLLADALTAHNGLSRLIVTSRVLVRGFGERVQSLPVNALGRDEAVLLARELPRLRTLLDGMLPGVSGAEGRDLATRVLAAAQGHPRLLELADSQAADADELRKFLARTEHDWDESGGVPGGFFSDGFSTAAAEDFIRVLDGWTRSASADLPTETSTFLRFLCALEERHRTPEVAGRAWPLLWHQLHHPDQGWLRMWEDLIAGRHDAPDGGPPAVRWEFAELAAAAPNADALLARLAASGLVELRPEQPSGLLQIRIHPQVAATISRDADPALADAVARELAFLWFSGAQPSQDPAGQHRAGWREALPYLIRLRAWDFAVELIGLVVSEDQSRATALSLLPVLQQIAAATAGHEEPRARGSRPGDGTARKSRTLLARVRERVRSPGEEPDEEPGGTTPGHATAAASTVDGGGLAEGTLDAEFRALAAAGEHGEARTLLDRLVAAHLEAGRAGEAARLARQAPKLTRRGGFGPWTAADDARLSLYVRLVSGESRAVLGQARDLLARLAGLPDPPTSAEAVAPWAVRENVMLLGAQAANEECRWPEALEMLAALAEAKRQRGAPDKHVALVTFNMFGPLLELGLLAEAEAALDYCAGVYERDGDALRLGRVHEMRGVLAHRRDANGPPADLASEALAIAYRHGGLPEDVAVGHQNLALALLSAGDAAAAVPHAVAVAVIDALTASARAEESMDVLVLALAQLRPDQSPPGSVPALCTAVGQVPGVRLHELLDALAPRRGRQERALRRALRAAGTRTTGRVNDIIARSQDPGVAAVVADMERAGITPGDLLGPGMSAISPAYMAFWDPVLSALQVVSAGGDEAESAAGLLESALAEAEGYAAARQLAASLRRLAGGERSPSDLAAGLDPLDTAIVLRALGVLAGTVALPPGLWQAVPLRGVIMNVIIAVGGFRGPSDQSLEQYLATLDAIPETVPLAAALRAILAGERDPDVLRRDLGPESVIVTAILTWLGS